MGRMIPAVLILILFVSCINSAKKEKFNPKAIALNNKAVELLSRFEKDSAMIFFNSAILTDDTYYLPHVGKAGVFTGNKQYDKALNEMDLAIRKQPDYAEGWTFAGMLNDKLGNSEKASVYYKNSIKIFDERIINPDNKDKLFANRFQKAYALILLGQEQEGKEEMMKIKKEKSGGDLPDDKIFDEMMSRSKQELLDQF